MPSAKSLSVVAVLALLAGCGDPGLSTSTGDNPRVPVTKLLTQDGCTVYRFPDAGREHYFTNCTGSVSTIVSCGKNCRREDRMETVVIPRE
jgi:hypothetical protein